MMNSGLRHRRNIYLICDYLTTVFGVMVFECVRYFVVPVLAVRYSSLILFLQSWGVIASLAIFPPFMLIIYYISGYYICFSDKSRVSELLQTACSIAIGSFIFFMVVLLNDVLPKRRYNYEILILLFCCIFLCVYPVRLLLTSYYKRLSEARHQIRRAIHISYSPAGSASSSAERSTSHPDINIVSRLSFGNIDESFQQRVRDALNVNRADCFIFDVPKDEDIAFRVLGILLKFQLPIYVKPSPSRVLLGIVRYNSVSGDPLVDVSRITMPDTVVAIKRTVDVVVSSLGLVVTFPLSLLLATLVKFSSRGPVLYRQQRLGLGRQPFTLYKFRTMITDSEPDGPRLTADGDPRITKVGRVMRRYRLDEIPNLWNVLKGDMSLVGPRPEREFFVNKIVEVAPHYNLIQQVRPGLTSWGMVKYGYASDVDQMVERLTFDILYIQNLSLALDLKIIFHTISTLLKGEGK